MKFYRNMVHALCDLPQHSSGVWEGHLSPETHNIWPVQDLHRILRQPPDPNP